MAALPCMKSSAPPGDSTLASPEVNSPWNHWPQASASAPLSAPSDLR